jgi:hypothetical protein
MSQSSKLKPSEAFQSWILELTATYLGSHPLARKRSDKTLSSLEKKKIEQWTVRLNPPPVEPLTRACQASQNKGIPDFSDYLTKRLARLELPEARQTPDGNLIRKIHEKRPNPLALPLPGSQTQLFRSWLEALPTGNPVGFLCAHLIIALISTWIAESTASDPAIDTPLARSLQLRFERNLAAWEEFDWSLKNGAAGWDPEAIRPLTEFTFRMIHASWFELLDETDPGVPHPGD